MKIGMSLTSSYPLTQDSRTIMENLVEEVKLMAQLGFDSFSLGDHHLTHNHYVQVLPAISSLSAISGDMQLLPLFLLPFYNPILLAEQLATLDVISGGRTTVINALGYDAAAFTAFQTTQRARVSRFTETFEIMRMLWERDGVSYKGRPTTSGCICVGGIMRGPITGTSPWRKSSARCSKPGLRPSSSR